MLGGDRVRGRWDRVDVVATEAGTAPAAAGPAPAATDRPSADVVSPTLGILGPERVTITDYKSSDVRDPAKARQRARESLQLQIYAMGYEAMTGRLPDAIALYFLESGPHRRGRGRPAAAGQGARPDRHRGGRDAGPRLHAEARLPGLHLLRVPRHLPVERRSLSGPTARPGRVPGRLVE